MSLDHTALDRHHGRPALRRPRRLALVAIAAALTVGGVACADNAEEPRADTESIDSDQTSAAGGSTDTTVAGDGETATDDEPTEPSDAGGSGGGEVLGTASAQLPYTLNSEQVVPLRADVSRLDRHDDLVELTITLTNESDPSGELAFAAWRLFEDPDGFYDVSGIGLVDAEGQKVYLPVRDGDGRCLCTDGLDALAAPPGEWILLNATIGGVPDDVEQVDVAIPGFPTIVGLTIQ